MQRIKYLLLILVISTITIPICDIIIMRWRTPMLIENRLRNQSCLIQISDLDKDKLEALIKVEDPTFFENNGLDFKTPGAGFTSISQAVGKIIYFKHFNPGLEKIRLIYLTRFALYPKVSKNDILTVFLNYVYLGNLQGQEIVGFEKAANSYYHQSVKTLSKEEFLSIVAMLMSPKKFHIIYQSNQNKERVKRIKNFIQGKFKPLSWSDVELEGCK